LTLEKYIIINAIVLISRTKNSPTDSFCFYITLIFQ
jgi:hypothetical protein